MIIELKSHDGKMHENIEAKFDLSVKDIKALTRVGMLAKKSVLNGDYEKAADGLIRTFEKAVDAGLKIAGKTQSSTSEEDL